MKTAAVLCLLLASAAPAFGQGGGIKAVRVASGLSRPLFVTHAPGDRSRLFILEQYVGTTGQIRIFDVSSGTLLSQPFLQVTGIVAGGEQGLLGLAFHPQYQSNGQFYVHYTAPGAGAGGRIVIARYRVSANPNLADTASAQQVLSVEHDDTNHNGGWMGFGPDGYLYVAMGDGGGGDDPGNNAQDINNLQGKMLRLDVNGDDFPAEGGRNYRNPPTNPFVGTGGADEIWSYGLRNPWRCSFDRDTGDLWIADVGQGTWEEIDFQPGGAPGGRNYGWRCMEGPLCRTLSGCSCAQPLGVPPIHWYGRTEGRSVTGGYVYRGCEIVGLAGTYFFADFATSKIWSMRYNGAQVVDLTDRTGELAPGGGLSISNISSFGEDYDGEMYIADYGGEIFKIVPAAGGGGGCCLADFNGDGFVDGIDYDTFHNAFEAGNPSADINGDGFVDGIDSDSFDNAFEVGC